MLHPKNRELHKMEASRKQQASLMARNANLKVVRTKQALKDTPTFDDDEAVAERIKVSVETMEARLGEGNDLSYPEIAEVCEVSQKVVYGWAKNGKISKAKIPTLCAVLGVSVEFLLTGREPGKGNFQPTDGNRLSREVEGVGGVLSETIVPVPIREPMDLIRKLSDHGGPLHEEMSAWLSDTTDTRSLPIGVLDPDHVRVPTWCMQIVTSMFAPWMSMSTFTFMSHKILPMEDDFACYLYKRDGVYQIAMGYVSYEGHDFSQPTFAVDGGFPEYVFKFPVRLKTAMGTPKSTDVILKGAKNDSALGRRFLGTQVAAHRWLHMDSIRAQTSLSKRLQDFDSLLEETWDTEGVIADQNEL